MTTPHNYGSFSYKVIDPDIRKILQNREELNNTLQIGTPFVKATATIESPEFLGDGNVGFTLGIHNHPADLSYENIYGNASGDFPVVGYTYTPKGSNERVFAKDPDSEVTKMLTMFDQASSLYTYPRPRFGRIPPPGITQFNIGRNKNGLLAIGEFTFSVPSLIQLEVLHRVFLVPNVGMVLEWGQQFALNNGEYGKSGLTEDKMVEHMFPWYNPDLRRQMLTRLGNREVGIQEIIQKYVIPTQGQYMWMFGRVANFSTKANSDGSFECSVKVVGPSEDAWAYSTKSTIVPPRDNSGVICADSVHSIQSYFKVTSAGLNLKSLLDTVWGKDGKSGHPWEGHVIRIENGNQKEGEPKQGTQTPNISPYGFGDHQHAYFMTWRFFVNVVLNDENVGVKAIFKRAGLLPQELKKISTLRKYEFPGIEKVGPIDDPYENYVGCSRYLRSIDPSTMIIVNEPAAREADERRKKSRVLINAEYTTSSSLSDEFKKMGDFTSLPQSDELFEKGLLSNGVWLNHKAVVVSILGADTLIKGISNLLDKMNNATSNYWNLTIDEVEPILQGDTHDYTVIDTHLRESSLRAVEVAFKKLHVFNKYVRTREDGKLVGSELIECKVDLSLPKRLFAQISTTGLVNPNDSRAASVGEVDNTTPIISDPNETLRRMFSITTLSPKQGEKNPDVTLQYSGQGQRTRRIVCGNTIDSQLALMSAGSGVGTTTITDQDLIAGATEANPNSNLYAQAKAGTPMTRPATQATAQNINTAMMNNKQQYEIQCKACPPQEIENLQAQLNPDDPSQIPPEPPPFTDLNSLAPKFKEKIEQLLTLIPDAKINETFRSVERQNWIYTYRRSSTPAPGGSSWHQYGLAVDIGRKNVAPDKQWYDNLGQKAKSLGLTWGGTFRNFYDPPHVQWAPLPGPGTAARERYKKLFFQGAAMIVWQEVGAI